MAQQMGFFDITNPSECDKPKPEFGGNTPQNFLAFGAAVCCKSKTLDEAVCRVNQCVWSMSLCLALHQEDFKDAEKKITNPKGMERNDEGQLEGDCALAILNGVEGEVCCTAGMKELPACVVSKVLDFNSCKNSWNDAFGPSFFDKAEAVAKAVQAGGYCVPESASPSTPCEDPSHFDAQKTIFDGTTCAEAASIYLPSTAAKCNEKPDGITTMANMTKILYANCCKPGSKPNPICGLRSSTATPCESKVEGEFLPEAM